MVFKTGLATIITDASMDGVKGVVGWAGRVIIDGQRFTFSGPIAQFCNRSDDAEIMAFCNTLHFAIAGGHLPPDIALLVQIDNAKARDVVEYAASMQNTGRTLSLVEKKGVTFIRDKITKHPFRRLIVKHVKAHLKHEEREARHHVHEAIDRLAKKEMRAERARRGQIKVKHDVHIKVG